MFVRFSNIKLDVSVRFSNAKITVFVRFSNIKTGIFVRFSNKLIIPDALPSPIFSFLTKLSGVGGAGARGAPPKKYTQNFVIS